jgi:hypothetical protein
MLPFLDGKDSKENLYIIFTMNKDGHVPAVLKERVGRIEEIFKFKPNEKSVLKIMISNVTPKNYKEKIDAGRIANDILMDEGVEHITIDLVKLRIKDLLRSIVEEELKKLTREHIKTRENLGGLQHTVGYILEDRAYRGLPALLERDFGVKLLQPLRREYIEIAPGKYVEANIIGLAQKNGKKVWIIGECKSQLKKKHINDFLKDVDRLKNVLAEEMILIAVTYQTSPPIQEYIKEKGIKLYFSYEFPLV